MSSPSLGPLIDTCQKCSTSPANHEPRSPANGVFKIQGFVRKRFLPAPPLPPPFFFWLSPHFPRRQNTENPVPRSFFAPKPYGNACYAGYAKNARMPYRMSQGVSKLEQHAVCDETPIWRMKSAVMTICKFCHVSENAL